MGRLRYQLVKTLLNVWVFLCKSVKIFRIYSFLYPIISKISMSNIRCFVLLFLSLCNFQLAKASDFDPYKMQVCRLSWYKPEYLTVTYGGAFSYLEGESEYAVNSYTGESWWAYDYEYPKHETVYDIMSINRLTDNKYHDLFWGDIYDLKGCLTTNPKCSEQYPSLYSVVLKVDGINAKSWTERMFYDAVRDGEVHEIELESRDGVVYIVKIDDSYIPSFKELLRETQYSQSSDKIQTNKGMSFYENAMFLTNLYFKKGNLSIQWDKDVDWSKYKTFDLALRGSDPLTDKMLFEIISKRLLDSGMQRDTENPDIIITISKKANESISYAYVPPTTKVVTTGSHTRRVYNWVGQFEGYQTSHDSEVITEGGYERELAQTSIFYEVCMLDASKLDRKVAPIIFQLKYDMTTNTKEKVVEVYKILSSMVAAPMWGTLRSRQFYLTFECPKYTLDEDGVIKSIHPESEAYKYGLRVGDRIKKIKYKKDHWEINTICGGKKYKITKSGRNLFPYFNMFTFKLNNISASYVPVD